MFTLLLILCFIILIVLLLIYLNLLKTRKEFVLLQKNVETLMMHSTDNNEYFHLKLLDEKKAHLLSLSYQIRETVAKQQHAIHPKAIEETPLHHYFSDSDLSKLFSPKQVLIIKQYWSAYYTYVDAHWKTSNGKMKTIFKGKADIPDSELAQLYTSSKSLVKQMDNWLIQLNSST